MIKLESAHIEEVRGIRKLDLDFHREKFAISGPNGSGKSGVIDAIEFGLTGNIGRLTGRGTKGLSVSEHWPHVDKTKFPDAAFVTLKVFLPTLAKTATITRKVNAPSKLKIEPADADIVAVLEEVADHPEITLSRREIGPPGSRAHSPLHAPDRRRRARARKDVPAGPDTRGVRESAGRAGDDSRRHRRFADGDRTGAAPHAKGRAPDGHGRQ